MKYEDIYLKQYRDMPDLLLGLTQYFDYYNQERMHQSLEYLTPDKVYQTATGGGAKIVDRFGEAGQSSSAAEKMGQRQPAAA